jgi:hypothetical protein
MAVIEDRIQVYHRERDELLVIPDLDPEQVQQRLSNIEKKIAEEKKKRQDYHVRST